MLFSVLKNISLKGKIDLIDYKDKKHTFGSLNDSEKLYVKVKLNSKSIHNKLFINPSLYLGEGYMNREIIILEGTIEDFINIIT